MLQLQRQPYVLESGYCLQNALLKKKVIFVCLFMSYSLQVTRLRFSFAKGSEMNCCFYTCSYKTLTPLFQFCYSCSFQRGFNLDCYSATYQPTFDIGNNTWSAFQTCGTKGTMRRETTGVRWPPQEKPAVTTQQGLHTFPQTINHSGRRKLYLICVSGNYIFMVEHKEPFDMSTILFLHN